jgi:hypothetical protein
VGGGEREAAVSTFSPDEIRAQLRAQKIPDHLIERFIEREAARLGLATMLVTRNEQLDAIPFADEAKLEAEVVVNADKQMRALGFIVVNYSQPRASKQTAGVQDHEYFHIERRIFFKWEAKSPTGEQKPAQVQYQEWCDATGTPYFCGTDRELFDWLLARYPLVRDEQGHLIWRGE